jgi:hypothetical protein
MANGQPMTQAYGLATKARQAYPGDPEITKALGILDYRSGLYPQAAELLKIAARKRKDDPRAPLLPRIDLPTAQTIGRMQGHLAAFLGFAPFAHACNRGSAQARRVLGDLASLARESAAAAARFFVRPSVDLSRNHSPGARRAAQTRAPRACQPGWEVYCFLTTT